MVIPVPDSTSPKHHTTFLHVAPFKNQQKLFVAFLQDLALDFSNKTGDANGNVSRKLDLFSPDVDFVFDDISAPCTATGGLMTPYDPNLDFEAGLTAKEQCSDNKENEELDLAKKG